MPDYIMRWLASRFLDVDTQEELGILTPEVRSRKMAQEALMRGDTAGPSNGGGSHGGNGAASGEAAKASPARTSQAKSAPGGSPPEHVPAPSAPARGRGPGAWPATRAARR